jgi:hypothetical protein
MRQVTLNIKEIIGTPNAIIQRLGIQLFEYAYPHLSSGTYLVLDFSGITNLTSGFCNASIGQLYSSFPQIASSHIKISNIDEGSIWIEKINDSIILATNPEKAEQIDSSILALFE